DVLGQAMQDGRGRHEDVLAVTAPQRRRSSDRCVAVAQRARIRKRIGLRAVAEFASQAVLAVSAGQVLLDGHSISFANAPSAGEGLARVRHDADVFVPQTSWRPIPTLV